jgi:hypothetical protein
MGDELHHIRISYKQVPVVQQLHYALCHNRLVKSAVQVDERIMLPVLPVPYYHPGRLKAQDLDAAAQENGTYQLSIWERDDSSLPGFMNDVQVKGAYGYRKEPSEFFDQMLTRSVNIMTDLFYSIENPAERTNGPTSLLMVGFSRCQTSTKSYVTLESEVIMSKVLAAILQGLDEYNLKGRLVHRARLYYPKISIYDHGFDPDEHEIAGGAEHQIGASVAPANPGATLVGSLPAAAFHAIKVHLEKIPEGSTFTTLTQIVRQQVLISVLELGISSLVGLALGWLLRNAM